MVALGDYDYLSYWLFLENTLPPGKSSTAVSVKRWCPHYCHYRHFVLYLQCFNTVCWAIIKDLACKKREGQGIVLVTWSIFPNWTIVDRLDEEADEYGKWLTYCVNMKDVADCIWEVIASWEKSWERVTWSSSNCVKMRGCQWVNVTSEKPWKNSSCTSSGCRAKYL